MQIVVIIQSYGKMYVLVYEVLLVALSVIGLTDLQLVSTLVRLMRLNKTTNTSIHIYSPLHTTNLMIES